MLALDNYQWASRGRVGRGLRMLWAVPGTCKPVWTMIIFWSLVKVDGEVQCAFVIVRRTFWKEHMVARWWAWYSPTLSVIQANRHMQRIHHFSTNSCPCDLASPIASSGDPWCFVKFLNSQSENSAEGKLRNWRQQTQPLCVHHCVQHRSWYNCPEPNRW